MITLFPPLLATAVGMVASSGATSSLMLNLAPVDYLLIAVYFAFVIGIGWVLRNHLKTSADFFESGRSVL
jgi:solute:Na+ symporter, SSS family